MIRLLTKKNGEVVLDATARVGTTIDDVQEIAENEVCGGYADYAAVFVDGELYSELEE